MRQQQQPNRPARNWMQAPVHAPQYCVFYLKEGKQEQTAWMSQGRAHKALEIMRAKYGQRNAIIYMD